MAAAFAHTGVLAGKPHNREALEAAGRGFGRLAHLIDAVEDLADDGASGAYNPLTATGTGPDEARRHCDAAHADLRAAGTTAAEAGSRRAAVAGMRRADLLHLRPVPARLGRGPRELLLRALRLFRLRVLRQLR
ncbi:hypothetical protein SAMN05421811_11934 [Nonomuraea wenchangensis]|uniref:Uncharacterized protein n=1 Tax=Nonomuraea wenchangensis TaxID=568860 RepID=A0A1I0LM14_9ACTN|nr:hypothetical protein SAMN05421811_11934 [Nonomuraea wenchangensis]